MFLWSMKCWTITKYSSRESNFTFNLFLNRRTDETSFGSVTGWFAATGEKCPETKRIWFQIDVGIGCETTVNTKHILFLMEFHPVSGIHLNAMSKILMLLHFITYVMQQPFENYSGLLLVVVDWINIVTNKSQE